MLDHGCRLQVVELLKVIYFHFELTVGQVEDPKKSKFEVNMGLFKKCKEDPTILSKLCLKLPSEKINRLVLVEFQGFTREAIIYYVNSKEYYQVKGSNHDLLFTNSHGNPFQGDELAYLLTTFATYIFSQGKIKFNKNLNN